MIACNLEANSKAERGHQPIIAALQRLACERGEDWAALLPSALWADRSTTGRMTGYSTAYLMHGDHMNLPVADSILAWTTLS
ncbi:MAG: hypothetical protein BJ554DRAFT_3802 [Olpidium bornovanus]|uniref:Uncharacterized protein n=1 Tax=Olpidium bornovanus TaxID=278681 RepID=A0A8H8DFP1_9FUNG|nr:MAG: hypothetical protein BJ554DRAFT_3802 [Olpidium bornovanus]